MTPRINHLSVQPNAYQALLALQSYVNHSRETPFYSERERAALEWTEAVTRIGEGHVPDAVYLATRAHFSEHELVDLTMAVIAINGWNRLAIALRTVPGNYHPSAPAHPAGPAEAGARTVTTS